MCPHVYILYVIKFEKQLFMFILALILTVSNSSLKLPPSIQLQEVSDPVKPMNSVSATLLGIIQFLQLIMTDLGTLP